MALKDIGRIPKSVVTESQRCCVVSIVSAVTVVGVVTELASIYGGSSGINVFAEDWNYSGRRRCTKLRVVVILNGLTMPRNPWDSTLGNVINCQFSLPRMNQNMNLLRWYLFAVTALAGLVFVVPVRADFWESQDSSEPAEEEAQNIKPNEDRVRLFERETEPLADVAIGKWVAKVDYLNWQVNRQGLDFAIPTDGTAQAVGNGSVQNLKFGQASGVRAGIGYLYASGWDLTGNFTYYQNTASASATEPPGGNLWATRSHPNVNQEASTAAASGLFNYNVFDLEAGYGYLFNESVAIRPFGGLRWANIGQGFNVRYDGRDFDNAVVNNNLNMTGFGFRLGMEGYWHLGNGWSVFGRGAGSVLYGNFQSQLRETNHAGADTIVNVNDHYFQAVPVLETALGGSWQRDGFQFAAGYELNNWFNLGNRSMFPDNAHEGAYSPSSNNVLLNGFFVRCSLNF